MRHESKQVPQDFIKAQRVIVLLILEHTEGLAWSELAAKLDDLTPNALADALAVLNEEGVVLVEDSRIQASPCARRLDMLALICD
jgi:DNA-binding HxlR family transcriptional regulator